MKSARYPDHTLIPAAPVAGRAGRMLALLLLAGATFFAGQQAAQARSGDQVVGTLLGAGVGALVGQQFNGHDGAVIGGIVGAVAGSAIAHDAQRHHVQYQSPGHRYYRSGPPPRVVVAPPRYVTPIYQAPPRVIYRNPPVRFVQPGFASQPGHRAGHPGRQAQRAYNQGFRDGVRYGQWHR